MDYEELMKPRFKVIADYPGNMFRVGEILEATEFPKRWAGEKFNLNNNHPSEYPKIFMELHWWEERKDEDTPQYLKRPKNGVVFEPYHIDIETGYYYEDEKEYNANDYSQLSDVLPATESDYQEYISKIEK